MINKPKKIREITPYLIATNNMKYLGETLIKQVNDLCDKNFKFLKKEIEEDIRKWKDLPCSWIGRIHIIKMATLPKAIYRFFQSPSKFQHNSSQTLKIQYSTSYGKTNTQDSQNNPVQ